MVNARFYKLFTFVRDIINNQNQMIKLVFGSKNKIVKLEKIEYKVLQALIKQSFPDVPVDYMLSYLDQDRDEISLGSDEDLRILMSSGLKVNKIYIKQSLSQVIEVTDQIEPSFQIYQSSSKKTEIEEPFFKIKDPFVKQQVKVSEVIVIEKPSQEKKSLEISVPVQQYHSADEREVEQINKKPEKVEVRMVQPMLSDDEKEVPSQAKKQIKQERDEEKSENSKSFILSMPDTNKIQIDEATLNERIQETVKKILQKEKKEEKKQDKTEEKKQEKIQEKKEEKIPEVVIQNKQVLQAEKPRSRPKIFEEKKAQKKFQFEAELIYHGVICSKCKDQYGIIGVRYQCIFCDDFNLCSSCEEAFEHEHPLLKVKLPKQTFRKEQIIEKYRNQMYSNILAPGHYVPSISKDEAKRYLETSKAMVKESMERAQKMVDDVFLKLEMSHKNPYELQKPIHVPVETLRDKMNHLMNLFGLEERQARYFCEIHKVATKEELAEIYIKKKTNKMI